MDNKTYNGIVLFGEMGSGKDTFAEILAEIEPNCTLYNIGYICREFMKIANVKPEWDKKGREFGQLVSVKLREIDENILNDYTYARTLENNSFPIVTGGRTKEDFKYWTSRGFLTVGVNVDYDVRLERLRARDKDFNIGSLNHMTENDVNYIVCNLCEVVIDNSSDLESLKENASSFVKKYLNPIEK